MSKYKYEALEMLHLHPFVRKVWLVSSIVFFIFVSMLFLPWEQTIKGEGKLIATDPMQRDYNILATIDGFVDEVYVHENQFVKKGTPLFRLVDLDKEYDEKLKSIHLSSQEQYVDFQKQVENIQEKGDNLENYLRVGLNVYTQKFQQIKNKIESLRLKKVSLEKNHEIEKLNVSRLETLYKEGIESKRNFDLAQNIYVKAEAELKKIDIDIEIENNNLDIIKQEKEKFLKETQNKIKLLDNSSLNSKAKLKSISQDIQRNSLNVQRYESGTVVAQRDGFIVRVLQNEKNRLIKKGDPIIHFSPLISDKSILLKISDFNMPLLKEGLPARIMFYGWPALQISGWPKIRYGTFAGVVEKVEPISHEKGFYYARVVEDPKEPWPKGDNLRVGTQSTIWVRLNTVPIWYQMWRLMNAFPPQMLTPVVEKKK
ncbi:HlyD family secretion protein [Sulfurimonas aquatica]|nr:biotin/lipoyl-binding protein [Sulfurimonas aquatica]